MAATSKDLGLLPTAPAPSRELTLKVKPEVPLTLKAEEAQDRPSGP